GIELPGLALPCRCSVPPGPAPPSAAARLDGAGLRRLLCLVAGRGPRRPGLHRPGHVDLVGGPGVGRGDPLGTATWTGRHRASSHPGPGGNRGSGGTDIRGPAWRGADGDADGPLLPDRSFHVAGAAAAPDRPAGDGPPGTGTARGGPAVVVD